MKLIKITTKNEPVTMVSQAPFAKSAFAVYAVYDTGSSVLISPTDWAYSNYDPSKCGEQNVTISYYNNGRQFTTISKVMVIGAPSVAPRQPAVSGTVNEHKLVLQVFNNWTGFYAIANKEVFKVSEAFSKSQFSLFSVNAGIPTRVADNDYTVLGYAEAVKQAGNSIVTVVGNYAGKKGECSVSITVVEGYTPTKGLIATPTKTQYFLGDTIDKSAVTVTYDGTAVAAEDWDFIGMDSSSVGEKHITVYYDTLPTSPGGVVSTDFMVKVVAKIGVISAVTTKGSYHRGENFDYNSLKLTLHTASGDKIIPSRDATIIGFDSRNPGNVTPYAEYRGMRAPINVIGGN